MEFKATQEVLPMQRAVATAWPSAWIDAFVTAVDADGFALVSLDGDRIAVDAHVDLGGGEPVAFHPVAELLAVGGELVRARRR